MKNEIKVNEEYKLIYDGYCFNVHRFDEGGQEVRNPGTGEKVLTKPQWKDTKTYYNSIEKALENIALNASAESSYDLNSFIKNYQAISNEFKSLIKG